MNKNNELKPFIPFPRSYRGDYLDKEITKPEYHLLFMIRMQADMYGVADINTGALAEEYLSGKTTIKSNTITHLLKSLKTKKYIYYKSRQGARGSFSVYLDEFTLKHKYTHLLRSSNHISKRSTDHNKPRSEYSGKCASYPELDTDVEIDNQKIEELFGGLNTLNNKFSINDEPRGTYNDKDKYKKKNNNRLQIKEIKTSDFYPKSHEEERCRDIALEIEDKNMNFLLGKFHKVGIDEIERVYGKYKSTVDGNIKNKAAYFNDLFPP